MPSAAQLAEYLDQVLESRRVPDYPLALNGLEIDARGSIERLAAAVDFSGKTIRGAIAEHANFLIVHHGMFWSGVQPVTGPAYQRLRLLIENDIAVYSSHLPLDRHPTYGNNGLLAGELELTPDAEFAAYEGSSIGVAGRSNLKTAELASRTQKFCERWGGTVRTSPFNAEARTRRWAICTGAGASANTLREAQSAGIDTLIVGEGPYWTSIAAEEQGLTILYAGHYATETLGVRAIAKHLSERFLLPWVFVDIPSAL